MRALGFTHPTPPCAATLCDVLRHQDREVVEGPLLGEAEAGLVEEMERMLRGA